MLVGGIDGYPDAVIVVEDVQFPQVNELQGMVIGRPRLYEQVGGALMLELPFDPTPADLSVDPEIHIEEAMTSWVTFRHMTRAE